jgi:hypothetical protein
MPASFSTTEVFTSGQQNVSHTNLNAIVSGLSVSNIGASASEIATDGIKAQHLNSDTAGSGLEQDGNGALQVVGAGYTETTLSNSNVTLTRSSTKRNLEFSGTLSGAVVINASRSSAVAGDEFHILLAGVITTATNTLTFQENGSGSLVVFNNARNVTGTIILKYSGSAWKLFLQSVTQV